MPYKVCPSCQQASYSACVSSIWLCPYCGKELTLTKAIYNNRRLNSSAEAELKQRRGMLQVIK